MPKTKNLSKELWADIKAQWEDGAAPADLAKKFDIHVNSIHTKKRNEGWERVDDSAGELEALQAQLAEAQARAEAAEAQAAERAPTAKVKVYDDRDSVVEAFGMEVLKAEAMSALAKENSKRFRQGLPILQIEDSPELAAEIEKVIQDKLTSKTRFVSPLKRLRVLKMVKPNGVITQVPVEKQINNEQAQEGTALWKAKAKGYKPTDPAYCNLLECWNFSALDGDGRPVKWHGYCSEEHMALDPYLNGRAVSGVSTTIRSSLS